MRCIKARLASASRATISVAQNTINIVLRRGELGLVAWLSPVRASVGLVPEASAGLAPGTPGADAELIPDSLLKRTRVELPIVFHVYDRTENLELIVSGSVLLQHLLDE